MPERRLAVCHEVGQSATAVFRRPEPFVRGTPCRRTPRLGLLRYRDVFGLGREGGLCRRVVPTPLQVSLVLRFATLPLQFLSSSRNPQRVNQFHKAPHDSQVLRRWFRVSRGRKANDYPKTQYHSRSVQAPDKRSRNTSPRRTVRRRHGESVRSNVVTNK